MDVTDFSKQMDEIVQQLDGVRQHFNQLVAEYQPILEQRRLQVLETTKPTREQVGAAIADAQENSGSLLLPIAGIAAVGLIIAFAVRWWSALTKDVSDTADNVTPRYVPNEQSWNPSVTPPKASMNPENKGDIAGQVIENLKRTTL